MARSHLLAVVMLATFAAPAIAAPNARLLAAATAARPEQLKLLETLVNIDSGTGDAEGGRKIAAIVTPWLKGVGATVEAVPAEAPGLPENLVATVTGTGKLRILLICHMDTVFEPGTVAKRPFAIDGDKARGPGVGDEKGGVVEGLYALKLLRDLGFKDFAKITMLVETSEERGSPGTRKLIDKLLGEHDVELNLEPGDAPDKITVWRKGSTSFVIDVKGKAAHAGVAPQDGRNAAVEMLHQLGGLDQFPHSGDGLTVNLTLMSAGSRYNIIPDRAQATLNVRIREPAQGDMVDAKLKERAATPAVAGTTVTVSHEASYPPLPNNPATDALAARARAI